MFIFFSSFANKQDKEGALNKIEITQELDLQDLSQRYKFKFNVVSIYIFYSLFFCKIFCKLYIAGEFLKMLVFAFTFIWFFILLDHNGYFLTKCFKTNV